MSDFASRKKTGLIGECRVAKWLIGRGFYVIPAYKVFSGDKPPAFFSKEGVFCLPDMLVFDRTDEKSLRAFIAEDKLINDVSVIHNGDIAIPIVSIRQSLFEDYCGINTILKLPVHIYFYVTKNAGYKSGLYTRRLGLLKKEIFKTYISPHKVVYYQWNFDTFDKVAEEHDLPKETMIEELPYALEDRSSDGKGLADSA